MPFPGFDYPDAGHGAVVRDTPRGPSSQSQPHAANHLVPQTSDYFVSPGVRFYYDEVMARQEAIAAAARRAAIVNPRDKSALYDLIASKEWTDLKEVGCLASSVGIDIAKNLAAALYKENYLLALLVEHDKEVRQLLFHGLPVQAFTTTSNQPNV